VFAARDRRDQLIERITTMMPGWSMAPLVEALRGLRGIDFISAVTFVAAVGDLGRFANPRQLMAYLGLVPSEQSSGEQVVRGGITKTGNREARRMLVEAAWSYRYPARVAKEKVEIGIEACSASHQWARLLQSFGHSVKLIAPQLVKPYASAARTMRRTLKRSARR
jgi:transposase